MHPSKVYITIPIPPNFGSQNPYKKRASWSQIPEGYPHPGLNIDRAFVSHIPGNAIAVNLTVHSWVWVRICSSCLKMDRASLVAQLKCGLSQPFHSFFFVKWWKATGGFDWAKWMLLCGNFLVALFLITLWYVRSSSLGKVNIYCVNPFILSYSTKYMCSISTDRKEVNGKKKCGLL